MPYVLKKDRPIKGIEQAKLRFRLNRRIAAFSSTLAKYNKMLRAPINHEEEITLKAKIKVYEDVIKSLHSLIN